MYQLVIRATLISKVYNEIRRSQHDNMRFVPKAIVLLHTRSCVCLCAPRCLRVVPQIFRSALCPHVPHPPHYRHLSRIELEESLKKAVSSDDRDGEEEALEVRTVELSQSYRSV